MEIKATFFIYIYIYLHVDRIFTLAFICVYVYNMYYGQLKGGRVVRIQQTRKRRSSFCIVIGAADTQDGAQFPFRDIPWLPLL